MTTSPKQAESPVRRRYEIAGIPVAIEFPKGSIKTGVDDKGVAWARTYKHDYGFIDGGPLGGDGEVFDVYVGPAQDAPMVFVVNQLKKDGTYDESKGMLGFPTEDAALMGYLKHYPEDWLETRVSGVKAMTVEEFKAWLNTPGVAKAASRKTANPNHWDTAQFDQWFDGSKIVDKEGNPLRVYHGTNTGPSGPDGTFDSGRFGYIYVTPSSDYADGYGYGQGHKVFPLYAKALKPLDLRRLGLEAYKVEFQGECRSHGLNFEVKDSADFKPVFQWVRLPGFKEACEAKGYDAIWLRERDASMAADALLLFDPKQVKSAIGNRGTYDGEDPRITASVKTAMSAIRLPQEEVDTFVIELHKAILTHLKLAAKSNPLTSKLGEIKTVKGPHKGSFYSFLPTKTYNVSGFSATPVDADSSLYVEGSVLLEAHQTDIDRVVVWGMMSTSKASNSRSEGFNKRGTMRLGLASHMTLGDAIARLQKDKTEAANLRSILIHEITHAFQYLNIDEKPTASGLPRYYKPVGDPFTDAATGRRRQNYQIDEAEYHNDPKEVEALVGQLVDRCRGFYRRRNSKPVSEHDVVTLLEHEPVWVAWSPTLTEANKREIYKEVYKALVDDKARKAGSVKTADFRDITLQFLKDTGHEHLINEDGSITVYHGTSTKNAKGIETSGKFKGFPFFAIDETTAQKFSRQAGPRPTVLTLKVDPDSVLPTGGEYLSARMEGLHRGSSGVWGLPTSSKTASRELDPVETLSYEVWRALGRYGFVTSRMREAALSDPWEAYTYAKAVLNRVRDPQVEAAILREDSDVAVHHRSLWRQTLRRYAIDVIKGRWPEAERFIAEEFDDAAYYCLFAVKNRWPDLSTREEVEKGIWVFRFNESSCGDYAQKWLSGKAKAAGVEEFPLAGRTVDGLTVGDHVPNMGSIAASLTNYTVLDGVRAVPLSAFDITPYTSTSDNKRVQELAVQIQASGRIDPLIVVVDVEGPYVLEGGHRLNALALCGVTHLPAVIVLDHDEATSKTSAATLTLWHGGNLDSPYDESMSHRKGRAEWGPGLYMSTSWQVAQKYAKGGRKLYRITIAQGNEADDVLIPVEDAREFAKTYITKARLREVLEAITRRQDRLTADTFLNIMVNYDGLKPAYTGKLRMFLVEHGVDYSIHDNAFGWGERMVVLFNMAKILKKERIPGNMKLDEFDLPTNWKEASVKVAKPIPVPTDEIDHIARFIIQRLQAEAADDPTILWNRKKHWGGMGVVQAMQFRATSDWTRPDGTVALHKGDPFTIYVGVAGAYPGTARRFVLSGSLTLDTSEPTLELRLSGPTLMESNTSWLTDRHLDQSTTTLMLLSEIKAFLVHEFTHLLDPRLNDKLGPKERQEMNSKLYKGENARYHNNVSFELRAYLSQCVHELEEYVKSWGGLWGQSFYGILEELPHWRIVRENLTPENRKVVLKELGRVFEDIRSEEAKQPQSA